MEKFLIYPGISSVFTQVLFSLSRQVMA